ncbi:MAG: hypothetical protein DRI57_14340 [Deltaproteobacteria bacterium]|nr:MAG: hypothetical protein DRI57_14340 [Deltaproteobacteria bacterium]
MLLSLKKIGILQKNGKQPAIVSNRFRCQTGRNRDGNIRSFQWVTDVLSTTFYFQLFHLQLFTIRGYKNIWYQHPCENA